MKRLPGSTRLLGIGLLLMAGGCAVYVLPAEEADSREEAPGSSEGSVANGAAGVGAEADRPDDEPGVQGARRRDATATETEPGVAHAGAARPEDRRALRRARAGSRRLHVPPGHHPPAGLCRMWYEDVPPGRQPAAAPCEALLDGSYPEGAFILYGGESWDGDYDWRSAAEAFPGVVPPPVIALAARVGAPGNDSARRRSRSDPGGGAERPGLEPSGLERTGAVAVEPPERGDSSDGARPAAGRRAEAVGVGSGGDLPRAIDVPPGQRPPEGLCRVWREGRSPRRQEPSVRCEELAGRELESGAFVLYGDRAFDVDHDWAAAEAREPGTVPPPLSDILLGSAAGSADGEATDEGATDAGAERRESGDRVGTERARTDSAGVIPEDGTPVVDVPKRDSRRPGAPRR